MAAIQILSLLRLARRETPLERDIILLATPDEETGGLDGAGFLVREHPELLAEAEFLVTEGGGVRGSREARGDLPRIPPIWSVSVTEKSPCWLELETRGRAGHGSTPRPAAADEAMRLLRTLLETLHPTDFSDLPMSQLGRSTRLAQ